MQADSSPGPATFSDVLIHEYRALHGEDPVVPEAADEGSRLSAVQRVCLEAEHSALCLSGGGIRSGSFAVGVLQGLAALGILDRFDYLSTVSGGGYAGAWFSAWRYRATRAGHPETVAQALGRVSGAGVEPDALVQVRRLVRFLDPRVGVLSADVWTLVVTILRNLFLNWIVLIPLIAAALLVPRLYLSLLDLPSQRELVGPGVLQTVDAVLWVAGVVLLVAAMCYIALDLPSLGNRRWTQRRFLTWFLVPVCLTHVCLSLSVAWEWLTTCQHRSWAAVAATSAAALMAPGLAGLVMQRRGWHSWTWVGALVAGAAGGSALWFVKSRILLTPGAFAVPGAPGCADALTASSGVLPAYAVFDLPLSLGILALEITLLVGLSGLAMSDEDREWWARAMAWLLIVATTWLAAAGLVLYAHAAAAEMLNEAAGLSLSSGPGRAMLALLTFVTGGIATRTSTSAAPALGFFGASVSSGTGASSSMTVVKRIVSAAVTPLFALLLLLLIAGIDLDLVQSVERLQLVHGESVHPTGGGLLEVLLVMGGLASVGLVAGRRVSVNQFSLHGMYRSRLVRTFVGASRPAADRHPSRFTGFDPRDDVRLSALAEIGRPLHVVNTTLNLVQGGPRVAQERKGAAFTMSPLHVGSRAVGYRPADSYAEGLTLGYAITTSGAAVSPQMGGRSSPLLTFLLTLFNARLGVWLGNPGPAGKATWRRRDPGAGPNRILGEMLGRTSVTNPYVYLSDGGHFENLGLYEMVVRRCHTIVVCDAGCDGGYEFGDLGHAIRRVRIDLGIPIDFPDGVRMTADGQGRGNAHAAIARIGYSAIDPAMADGVLVYLKATLSGDEPVDVLNYARAHPEFPHEPTANQWFAEAQFESYRVLGRHTVEIVGAGMDARDGIRGFFRQAEGYVSESSATSVVASTRSPVSNPSVNLS
jgi:Patatin-like phospholipase